MTVLQLSYGVNFTAVTIDTGAKMEVIAVLYISRDFNGDRAFAIFVGYCYC